MVSDIVLMPSACMVKCDGILGRRCTFGVVGDVCWAGVGRWPLRPEAEELSSRGVGDDD